MASREARTFVLAAIGLVAIAGMFVWALAAPAAPEAAAPLPAPTLAAPAQAPAAPTPVRPELVVPAQAQPVAVAPKDPGAVDLFAGPMPEWMAELHERTTHGKWLDASEEKELYHFGQEHKDDARPQILLAWDSMNREWWGFAVRLYQAAYDADRRAKEDPTMLRDLVEIASHYDRVEYREATALIKEAYDDEALPKIDLKLEELRRSGDRQRVERLERLRNMIREN